MTSQKIHLTLCHLPYSEWFLLHLPPHTTALLVTSKRFCSAALQKVYLKLNPDWWRMASMSSTSSSQWLQLNSGLVTLQLRASRTPLFLLQLLPWWGSSKRTSPGGQGKILAHLTPRQISCQGHTLAGLLHVTVPTSGSDADRDGDDSTARSSPWAVPVFKQNTLGLVPDLLCITGGDSNYHITHFWNYTTRCPGLDRCYVG